MNIVDHMDAFKRFVEQTKESAIDEKLEKFKIKIIEPNFEYYSKVMGISDDGLRQYLVQSESKIEALLAGQDEAINRFHGVLKMFQDKFPEFQTDFDIHLLPSLNLFKGMAIPTQGMVLLLLGVDTLVELSDKQYQSYVSHELFHVYHYQCVPVVRDGAELAFQTMKMPPLWALLWTEGIASYAVCVMYPEIDEEDVLDWRTLVEQTKPLLPNLAGEARRILKSDLPQDVAGFFYFPRENDRKFPTGCGYYIGMLIAKILSKRQTIDQLFSLSDEALIEEIDLALKELQG